MNCVKNLLNQIKDLAMWRGDLGKISFGDVFGSRALEWI